ncbi:Hypothetical predicted protein [Mytilus galloprovincialis]|uniref:Uncharacterized protein n=1 Tax=Mytilus galloprovincialis TaxID=29158 RepID=A0A8B6GVR8_MYTGA|nr:Hypothetical predicted protein [Mytilus galloprovincialis]
MYQISRNKTNVISSTTSTPSNNSTQCEIVNRNRSPKIRNMCGKQYILLVLVMSAVLSESKRPSCRRMGGKCMKSCSGNYIPLPGGTCCGKKVCCTETCSNVGTDCEVANSERQCASRPEDCPNNFSAEDATGDKLGCCSSTLFPYCCVPQNK